MKPQATVRGLLIGGSGCASDLLKQWIGDQIPDHLDGQALFAGTLNIVLEVGFRYRTPRTDASDTVRSFLFRNETYWIERIDLREAGQERWKAGLILRNKPHPDQFNNIVEVVAPKILGVNSKQHFELRGPFETEAF